MEDVNPYFRRKQWAVRLAAIPIAIVLTPIIIALWLAVRLTSRGPGFYSQVRLGKHGKRFRILKLRTMRLDAESATGAVWSTDNDPRVTPLGRFLRKSHFDELPQIFNVIAGHMCFVGPRPERPEIAEKLAELIPGYLDRIVVKPGVTGWAQLYLPADKTLDCVWNKLGYDFTYIRSAGLWSDLRVCLATACKAMPKVGDWWCERVITSPAFRTAAEAETLRLRRRADDERRHRGEGRRAVTKN